MVVPPVEEAGGTPAPARGASEARMAREPRSFTTNTSPRSRSLIRFTFSSNRVAAEGEPAPGTSPTSLKHLRDKIRTLDVNGDGVIDEDELAAAVDTIVSEQRMKKVYSYIAIASFIMMCLLIAAIGGMTYGIVVATRDTKLADGSVMVSSKDGQTVVQVASYDMAIVDNHIVARQALPGVVNGYALGTTSATNASTASTVLRTAESTIQQAFSSRVSIKALMELRYLYLEGVGGAELAILVHGVARVPQAGSRWGTVVQILTPAGTITLDDTEITFSEDSAPLFANAGFITKGRRLLGAYDVYGFFNYIADMSVFNLPPTEHYPRMPNGDYNMTLKVYSPCTGVDGAEKCLMNVTSTNGSLVTVKDIPGVVTLSGARYVTHYESSIRSGSLARTVYNYPAWPSWRKVEVVDMDLQTLNAWMVMGDFDKNTLEVPSINSTNSTSYNGTPFPNYLCRQMELPELLVRSLANRGGGALMNGTANITVTFIGFEDVSHVGGTPRAARHFKLVVPQDGNHSQVNLPANVIMDYWDLQDAHNTPFLLTADLPWGTVRNEFISVASLTYVEESIFNVPDNGTCVQNPPPSMGLLWLRDPFVQPSGLSSEVPPLFTTANTSYPYTNSSSGSPAGRRLLGGLTGLEPSHGASRRLLQGSNTCRTTVVQDVSFGADAVGWNFHYTQWADPGGKLSVDGNFDYKGIVSLTGGVSFSWCALSSYVDVAGCLELVVGIKPIHVTINAKACAGFDPMSQTFYIWFDASIKADASILSGTVGVHGVIKLRPCGSTVCVWIDYVQAYAKCSIDLVVTSFTFDCFGSPWTLVSDEWLQGSKAQVIASPPIGFFSGSSSALLGRDVMLYSARTAPNYVCFDSNDGGNGGAAHMWPCDESNANQRFSIKDAGGGYVNLIENWTGYRRCITVDGLVDNGPLYYARDCTAGNQAQRFQIMEVVSGEYAVKSPTATRSDGTLVTKCLDNNDNYAGHVPWAWDCIPGVWNQYWLIRGTSFVTHEDPNNLAGTHIMIRSLFSNNKMCVDHDGAAPWTKMHLWDCDNNNDNQRWLLVKRSDGSFNIKSFKNGDIRCLGVKDETYNGAQWYTYDCDGSTKQQFTIAPSPRGAGYTLSTRYNGKCLDTYSADRGFNPTTWDCNPSWNVLPNQEWDISVVLKSYTGSYTQLIGRTVMIYSVRTGDTLCLDGQYTYRPGDRADGVLVVLSTCSPISSTQRWLVTDAGNGAISLIGNSGDRSRCLDVDDYFYILNDKVFHEITSLEDMNLVRYRVQNCNSSPTQQFYLTPAGDGAGFNIKGVHSGRCMDYNPADGTPPRQWDCWDGVYQHWEFAIMQ